MVYNAMKLFMEINPQLFDECSHEYTEAQNNADQVKAERKAKWERLAELAKRNSAALPGSVAPLTNTLGQKASPLTRLDEDPITQDSQKRLDALRLQDENASGRDLRRSRESSRQDSVSRPQCPLRAEADADCLVRSPTCTSRQTASHGRPVQSEMALLAQEWQHHL